jgi:hypothetical protein
MSDAAPASRPPLLVTAAVLLALLGLAISLLHFLWPTPLLFTLFMMVGQGAFAAGMLLYLVAILRDLRAKRIL